MSLIRDDDEACLMEVHARGAELLERYRELLEDGAPPAGLADALGRVVEARAACLEQLADRLRARGVLPSAGDPDRAWVQASADLLGADGTSLGERLVAAEGRWRDTLDAALDQAVEQSWNDEDAAVLERLSDHMDACMERLKSASN
ncbi:hypothetical protein [Halomonas denitrificans]|nr:hypothetical protein [Halomonas denitrificans]